MPAQTGGRDCADRADATGMRPREAKVPQERKNTLPKGTVLRDAYRIESILGAGGFAITYLGHHTGLDQKVAIKEFMPDQFGVREPDGTTVRPRQGSDDDYEHGLKRFSDEAQTLARFKHPGIVPVTDIFEANGTAYMVMEYVEGESLYERLARKGALSEPAFRNIFDPILAALEEIHSAGILHRDIKPANLYVRADNTPVLLDFGNSRQALGAKSKSLTVALTPGYAPGEQYSSRGKQGPWTDIYSLGATMYASIAATDPPEAPDRALDDDYVPLAEVSKKIRSGFSPGLLAAVDRALAVRPDDRPQDIGEFRDLLDGVSLPEAPNTIMPDARASQGPAAPQTVMSRSSKARAAGPESRERSPVGAGAPSSGRIFGIGRRPVAIAACVVLLLAAGGGFGWMKYQEAEEQRLAAEAQKRRIAAEKRRAVAMGRMEAGRWERAAVTAAERFQYSQRLEAWQRRVRAERAERRRTEEVRREEARRQIKAERNGGFMGGVKNFFEKILPGGKAK